MPEDPTDTPDDADVDQPQDGPAQDSPAQDDPEADWRALARKWERRALAHKKALDAAAPKLSEYDRIVEANKTDLERANESLTRWQSEAEKWRSSAATSRIQALAADFTDPTDAVTALTGNVAQYIDAGGSIDDAAIRRDLAEVLDKKPHWRRKAEEAARPRPSVPNPHQGSSGGGGNPAQTPGEQFAAILRGAIGAQ